MKSSGGGRGGPSRIEGRIPKEHHHNPLILNSSRPLAQVGERFPPTPVARSTDSDKMQSSANNSLPNTNSLQARDFEPTAQMPADDTRKLVATIPANLLATLRTSCESKASVLLLGRIQGKHPGLKTLTAWARETLHPTLSLLSLKANNVFEVTFSSPEGRTHALNQADLTCESASIFFSSWRPHFDAKKPQDTDSLDYPVWVQLVDLCQVLRNEAFLQTTSEQIGQVISIDSSDAYKAKLFGLRIRLLVRDLHTLPQVVVVPQLDGDGTVEYALEFSGLPHQCGRCRSRDHQVRHCPRKEQHRRNSNPTQQHFRNTAATSEPAQHPIHRASTDLTTQEEGQGEPEQHDHEETLAEVQSPALTLQLSPEKLPEPTPSPAAPEVQNTTTGIDHGLHTNDHNFPKLPSSKKKPEGEGTDTHTPNLPSSLDSPTPTHFVWRSRPPTLLPEEPEGRREAKGKAAAKVPESTPITRQGYRIGKLADDF